MRLTFICPAVLLSGKEPAAGQEPRRHAPASASVAQSRARAGESWGRLVEAPTQIPLEKRSHTRVPTMLTVLWDGVLIDNYALMTDLSRGGCYINSVARVSVAERIRVDTLLTSQTHLQLEGQVAHHQWPLGFGLRFSNVTEEEVALISRFVKGVV